MAAAAAKAGVINMGRDLCVDVGSKNIRINALAPGYFETEMNKEWLKSSAGRKLLENIQQVDLVNQRTLMELCYLWPRMHRRL